MTVIFPPKVSVLGDMAKDVRNKMLSEDFETALLPALLHGLVGSLSRASSNVLQGYWPWASLIIVPKEDFVAKVSYQVGTVAS